MRRVLPLAILCSLIFVPAVPTASATPAYCDTDIYVYSGGPAQIDFGRISCGLGLQGDTRYLLAPSFKVHLWGSLCDFGPVEGVVDGVGHDEKRIVLLEDELNGGCVSEDVPILEEGSVRITVFLSGGTQTTMYRTPPVP